MQENIRWPSTPAKTPYSMQGVLMLNNTIRTQYADILVNEESENMTGNEDAKQVGKLG